MPNGLYQLLMDRATQNQYPEDDPQGAMSLAREHLRSSDPNLPDAKVRPMNWLERITSPKGMQAATYPNGTVTYNPNTIGRNMEDNENLLRHELTHAKQNQGKSTLRNMINVLGEQFKYAYKDRPSEIEAYATATRRPSQDIEVPVERYGNPISGR